LEGTLSRWMENQHVPLAGMSLSMMGGTHMRACVCV
jgi:hypothetical protein